MKMHPMDQLDPAGRRFYRNALSSLLERNIPFLVGGAYALERHTGIVRHTKDFDIFVLPSDAPRTLQVLEDTGYQTEMVFPHWLGKAFHGDYFIDIIFNSGNGLCRVDDDWFANAIEEVVLDIPCRICPVEETIWQKAFIMERDRCDSADVAHLIRYCAAKLDWTRLLRRFSQHWRVLYAHLVLFGFIYPTERESMPSWVLEELALRLKSETNQSKRQGLRSSAAEETPTDEIRIKSNGNKASKRRRTLPDVGAINCERPPAAAKSADPNRLCQGTFLSATQYARDVDCEGFRDARLPPGGNMSAEDVARWTAAFVKP